MIRSSRSLLVATSSLLLPLAVPGSLLLLLPCVVDGFSSHPSIHHHHPTKRIQSWFVSQTQTTASLPLGGGGGVVLFSEPSDTSSTWDDDLDEIVTLESEDEETSSDSPPAVHSLMDMLPTDATAQVSDDVRASINEALYRLEKLSPTTTTSESSIAMSPLINGVWELKYVGGSFSAQAAASNPSSLLPNTTGAGGLLFVLKSLQTWILSRLPGAPFFSSSPLLASPSLVEWVNLEVVIGRSQPRVEASAQYRIAGNQQLSGTVAIVARLDVLSDVRLRETYQSIALTPPSFFFWTNNNNNNALGAPVDLPDVWQYTRDLYVTYVDEDLLIVRDSTGAPEVLVRQSKVFSRNWGTEPSDQDDLVPPGQE